MSLVSSLDIACDSLKMNTSYPVLTPNKGSLVSRLLGGVMLLDPLHPDISMYILLTVLYIFPGVLTRRICLKSRALLIGDHFLDSHDLNV